MKFKSFILSAVVLFTAMACQNEKNGNIINDLKGDYAGYSTMEFKYAKNPMVSLDQKLTVSVSATDDQMLDVLFKSSFAEFHCNPVAAELTNGKYILTGEGVVVMGMGDKKSEYNFNLQGEVASDKSTYSFKFTLPDVMGGTVITLFSGEASAELLLPGKYTGHSTCMFKYLTVPTVTLHDTLKIDINDKNLMVAYESSMGNFVTTSLTAKKADGVMSLEGSGKVSMGMGGNVSEYDFNVNGTVSTDKKTYTLTFVVPDVMGGITVELKSGEASDALAVTGSYTGTLNLSVGGQPQGTVEKSKLVIDGRGEKTTLLLKGFDLGGMMKIGDMLVPEVKSVKQKDGSYKVTADIDIVVDNINITGKAEGTINGDQADFKFQIKPGAMTISIDGVYAGKR